MSSPKEKDRYAVEDYADLLAELSAAGFTFVVIGGCAVGLYSRRTRNPYLTTDLDLYAEATVIREISLWLETRGVNIIKRPQPRTIPVTVFEWRGREVNLLSRTRSLSPPTVCAESARLIRMRSPRRFELLIVDPFELFREKSSLRRKKDESQITVLREFVETEVLEAMRSERESRARIAPARRYLWATGSRNLPGPLFHQMLLLAKTSVDYRFLAHHAPDSGALGQLLAQAQSSRVEDSTLAELNRIAAARNRNRRKLTKPKE